jgi:hypothetical protein
MHKILSSAELLNELRRAFPLDSDARVQATQQIELLQILGDIQSATEASFLTNEQFNLLRENLGYFYHAFIHVSFS